MRSPASTTSFTVLITVQGLINVPSIALAQTTTTTGSPQATNTNLVLNFAPIPTLYACAAYSFQWTLPSDLTNGARSQLVDLYVTNENIDQVIPGGSGSTASDSSVTSSGGSISSALTGGSSRAGSSSISSSGSISRTTSIPVPSSTIATPTTRPTSTTSSISTPTRPARRFVPRAAPTGSSIITKNITLISASSNQYTYPHVVLPLGRYILYAQARGDGTGKILGASNSFTVLRGGNPTCLNGTDSGSDGGQDDGGGSNGSTTGTIAGAVVGSILGTLLLAFLAFWLWRKRQRKTIWLSQSSLRMFSPPSEPRGIRGFFARGRGKRDSKESGRRGLNVQEETTEISGPTLMSTSGWRDRQDHASNPNSAGLENGYPYDREVKLGNEEKQTQNGRDIELTRLQHAPIGLNIPVLPKEPDRSGHISKPSAGSDSSPEKNGGEYSSSSTETSPATASSASNSWDTHGYLYGPERTEGSTMDEFGKAHSRGSRNLTGLQRNPSSGSTTLGRSLSSKRMSSGPGGPVKRKPVPLMPQGQAQGQGQGQGQGHSNQSSLDEVYSTTRPVHLEGVGRTESSEEMLTDHSVFPARPAHKQNREGQEEGEGMSRQSSSSSLAPSSSGSTVRPPGLAREGKRRESFLLIPDQPLSQD